MNSGTSTRYQPVYAPNGACVCSSPWASQGAVDVLQNGGTAMDAAVAAIAVDVATSSRPDHHVFQTITVCEPQGSQPLHVRWMLTNREERLHSCSSLLRKWGSRSLYDLVSPAIHPFLEHPLSAPEESLGLDRVTDRAREQVAPSSLDRHERFLGRKPVRFGNCDIFFAGEHFDGATEQAELQSLLQGWGHATQRVFERGCTRRDSDPGALNSRGTFSRASAYAMVADHRGLFVGLVESNRQGLSYEAQVYEGGKLKLAVMNPSSACSSLIQTLLAVLADGLPLQEAIESADPQLLRTVGIQIDRVRGILIAAAESRDTANAAGY